MISIENAVHYIWGDHCDGWHLLKCDDMNVTQERIPVRCAETMHYPIKSRQFFYILEGEGIMILRDGEAILQKGQGIEIAPKVKHQFKNNSQSDLHFLVIFVPSTRGDRVNCAPVVWGADL